MRQQLRAVAGPWSFAALVPLLDLVADDPSQNAMTACVYLGLLNGWLVTEFDRRAGPQETAANHRNRTIALLIAVTVNVGVFIFCGYCAGVETQFPFPLMAALSVVPAVGIVSFVLHYLPVNPYGAIILSGLAVLACKLAGCVVARIVYGPDYIAQGYVSADWRTAKLMITLMWTFTTLLSVIFFAIEFRRCSRRGNG
jgi:hypothetical protein